MPNWCENELTVTGNVLFVGAFLEGVRGEEGVFDFQRVIPIPDEVNDGSAAVVEWAYENWGTKWNVIRPDISELLDIARGRRKATIRFDTAWSPPLPVVRKLISDYPLLVFNLKYWEGGSGFCGVLKGRRGREVGHKLKEYRGTRGG